MPDPNPRTEAAAKALRPRYWTPSYLPHRGFGDQRTVEELQERDRNEVRELARAALAAADAVDEVQKRAVAQATIDRTLRTLAPPHPDDREALVQIVRNEVASYGAVTDPARGVPESLSAVDSDMPERIVDLILSRRSRPTEDESTREVSP